MSRETNVRVVISGDSRSAEQAFRSASREAAIMERQLEKQRQAMTTVGTAMTVAGAAIATGLAVATTAAVQWESAFAGVRKTVDGSAEQLGVIEGQLRSMARTLPSSHEEIAAVAEAAGQLGVATPQVAGFTRTMVDLGETTNMTATDAATALARFTNIMGTSRSDVDRLGSSIVALGNNSATTESEIVDMALRIAGAGAKIGLSESDVLAYAAALSSVGVEAEAGGTAISQAFIRIDKAVREGGEQLEGLAQVAGMTAQQFATAYRDDAAGAVATFVEGLGVMKANGEDVFGTLDDLGLTGIRLQDSLLRASAAGDLLRGSLDLGADSWEENSALAEEAAQRYETTAAKVEIAKNNIRDLAIETGNTLLPALGEGAETLSGFMMLMGDLPEPVQEAATVIGVAAAAIGLLGGAALVATPKLVAFNAALVTMGGAGATIAATLRTAATWAGRAAGPIGAIIAIFGALATEKAELRAVSESLIATLDAETQAITANTEAMVRVELAQKGVKDLADQVGVSYDTIVRATMGNRDAQRELAAAYDAVNEAANAPWEGGGPAEITEAAEAARGQLGAWNELNKLLGDYSGVVKQARDDAYEQAVIMYNGGEAAKAAADRYNALAGSYGHVADAAAGVGSAVPGFEDLNEVIEGAEEPVRTLEDAMNDLQAAIRNVLDRTFSYEEANDAFTSSLQRLEEGVKRAAEAEDGHARKLDGSSESALRNREAMRSIVAAAGEVAATMVEQGASTDEVSAKTEEMREQIRKTAERLGLSKEDADRYASALDRIPTDITTFYSTAGAEAAERQAQRVEAALARIPRSVRVDITTYATEVKRDAAAESRGGTQPRITPQADGGVWLNGRLTMAANGLLREPMYAPAGANILWAEQSTGGETYIPHAPEKRHRSVDLLAQTNAIFGNPLGVGAAGGGGVVQANLILDGQVLARVLIDPLSGEIAQRTDQAGGREPWRA